MVGIVYHHSLTECRSKLLEPFLAVLIRFRSDLYSCRLVDDLSLPLVIEKSLEENERFNSVDPKFTRKE